MAIVTNIDLLMNRRTKIVATVGSASSSPEKITSLILAGVAKIEKPEALENAEEILDVSDAVMIARGDSCFTDRYIRTDHQHGSPGSSHYCIDRQRTGLS